MLTSASLAILLAGISAFLFIFAFVPAGSKASSSSEMRDRLKNANARRDALRESVKLDDKARKKGVDEDTLRMMRKTIEKFRMGELLSNSDLKMSLAQAGFRGQKAPIFFLFVQIVLPFVLALATLLYFAFLYAGGFQATRHLLICLMVMVVGFYIPKVMLKNMKQKRQLNMQRAFPDALDLTVICVEAGMSVERSFHRVAEEIGPQSKDLAEEIALTTAELSYLGDRSIGYENFAKRTGMQPVKALTSALIQAERYGTPVAAALRVLSEESRNERMSMAERKAAALPAKLTVPMIVFFLPVLFVVIIGPAVLQLTAG